MAFGAFKGIGELLSTIEVHSNKECSLPPILDTDPILAAHFLTIADSEKSLELCLSMYDSLRKGSNKYPIFESCINWSFTNFLWFWRFTKELISIVTNGERTLPPDLVKFCPKIDERRDRRGIVDIYPPVFYRNKRAVPVSFRSRVKNDIDKYRIQYIAANYTLEDFRDGLPAWYSISNTIIFEDYNVNTNTRIRVIHKNMEFKYYICGASDNWREIENVPAEMDHVIAALIFRN